MDSGGNFITGSIPYIMGESLGGGTGSYARVSGEHKGRPIAAMNRGNGSGMSLTKLWDVDGGTTRQFLTVAIDMFVNNASSGNLKISILDGVSTTLAEFDHGANITTGWRTVATSAFIPSGVTQVRVTLLADTTSKEVQISNLRVYTGLYMLKEQGYYIPYWQSGTTPIVGAWLQGDKVWNSGPSAGEALGWMNVADGTTGTWVDMAHIGD